MMSFVLASSGSTAVVILLIVLVVALLSGLAFVMSRANRLKPHRRGVTGNQWHLRRRGWQARAERQRERDEAEQQADSAP
jgi:hypothetical protein